MLRPQSEVNSNGEETRAPLPPLSRVSRFYLMVFLLLLIAGSILQALHLKTGLVLTQVLLILLPALWFRRKYNLEPWPMANLSPLPGRLIPVILKLSLSTWILNVALATLLVWILKTGGFKPQVILPAPESFIQYLLFLLIIAVFPGFCEEVLFRGTLMPALGGNGLFPALIFSSLLFSLFHVSLTNLLSTLLLGLLIGLTVIWSGSLWAGVLYHTINNALAVTYLYLSTLLDLETVFSRGWTIPLAVLILAAAVRGAMGGLRTLKNHPAGTQVQVRRPWLPPGWFNWATGVVIMLYLVLAALEMLLGFGIVPWEPGL